MIGVEETAIGSQRTRSIAARNIETLGQGLALLDAIDVEIYRRPGRGGPSGSIGNHIRHCLDVYSCLLRGMDTGRIDYGDRRRDDRIANDPMVAIEHLLVVVEGLERLESLDGNRALLVRSEDEGAVDDPRSWCRSTVSRELQYTMGHTIHHYALVACLLQNDDIELPEGFGIAPSTIAWWRSRSE